MDEKLKWVSARVSPELHREVRTYAAQHGLKMEEVVKRALATFGFSVPDLQPDASSADPSEDEA